HFDKQRARSITQIDGRGGRATKTSLSGQGADVCTGERRLAACRSRQLAEVGEMSSPEDCAPKDVAGRAASNYTLTGCAPQSSRGASAIRMLYLNSCASGR